MAQRRSVWNFGAKAAVSLVLLWLPLRHVALDTVLIQIAAVDWKTLLGAFLILAATTLAVAQRWSVILRALGMPRGLGLTYPLTLIGLFFGQALPAGVGGDVVRVWLGHKAGLTIPVLISSVLGDRLAGLFAILLIVTVELVEVHRLSPDPALFYGLCVVLAAFYAGFAVVLVLDRLPAPLRRFRIVRGLARISADLRVILFSSHAAITVLSLGAIIQLGNVLAVFALAQGLNLTVGIESCLLIVPLANILQSLPISIAGWGVRESFFVAAFGMIGVTAPQAIAVSVIFGLLIVASSLPGGVLWLVVRIGVPIEKLSDAVSAEPLVSSE
jgi:glycosyltransferase 2 family protein